MDLAFELTIAAKLTGAFALGALIGYDRERQGQSAGIRTYAAVSMGAALYALIAQHLEDPAAPTYIIAHVSVGIGFLGAGMIFRDTTSQTAHGLTTAASVWCTAAVGVAVGVDMFVIAVVATLALYLLLSLERWKWYNAWKERIQSNAKRTDVE
jgi:putative Mg2+ transporter-C (MgtC) family protein